MKIKVGDKFTTNENCSVTVVDYGGWDRVTVMFGEGHTATVRADHLRHGRVKNPMLPSVLGVGFFGVGSHPAKISGKNTKPYSTWVGMITRGYCDRFKKRNTSYAECTVDREWHNYQNFAKWFTSQKQCERLDIQLDKDILVPGNKVYSKDNCILIPREINTLLLDNPGRRGELPVGVHLVKRTGKYQSYCNVSGNKNHLGFFDSPVEAHRAYRSFKESHVRSVAQQHREEIGDLAYHALINYRVVCPVYEKLAITPPPVEQNKSQNTDN